MASFRRKLMLGIFKLFDLVVLMVALVIASRLATYHSNPLTIKDFFYSRIEVVDIIGFLGMLILWHILFHNFQLYRSRRLGTKVQEYKDILKATTVGAAIFIIAGFFFNIKAFTPYFILMFWLSSSVFSLLSRTVVRYILKKGRIYGRNLRHVVIVGTNQRAYAFARMIEDKKELGYRVLGYIDKIKYMPKKGITMLGSTEDVPTIMQNHVIDELVIALPVKSFYEEIKKIVQKAEEQGITIRFLSQLFDTKIAQSRSDAIDDFSVLTICSGPQDSWQYMSKRAIDLALACTLLILVSPLLIITAIAIKLSSPGPVVFAQDRVGYNKRLFRLYKFRTMVNGAEKLQKGLETLNEMDGPVFKIQNDPRTTKLGRWLRKTSIDELPQIFNVLIGDMSLVGPRPLPVRDYTGFNEDWQRRRFSVLPGITCIWQINGRNETSFEDWMKQDMEYIDSWKLSSDLMILLKTIPAVIKGKGAV